MHTRPFLSLLFAGLLAACSSPADRTNDQPTTPPLAGPDSTDLAPPLEPMDTTAASATNAQSDTLKSVRRRRMFSSPSAPDVFQLVLRGDSLLNSVATFTITAADGTTIFRETMPSADLEAALVYELSTPTATKAQREAYLRRRVNEFFAEQNFRRPAIDANAPYEPGVTDQATWDDLRRHPDAVGFRYLVGKENRKYIAWSPLKKQVVHYGRSGG